MSRQPLKMKCWLSTSKQSQTHRQADLLGLPDLPDLLGHLGLRGRLGLLELQDHLEQAGLLATTVARRLTRRGEG